MNRAHFHFAIGGLLRALGVACCLGLGGFAHAQDSAGDGPSGLSFEQSEQPESIIVALPEHDGVVATVRGPGTFTIWTSDESEAPIEIDSQHFAIVGIISTDGVVGSAHLELLCTIDGNTYFSRTLALRGPMQSITGSLERRFIVLPFDTLRRGPAPTRLELRVIMPGEGTITVERAVLGTVSPQQFAAYMDTAHRDAHAWWSDRQAGWIGGIAGSAIGIMGGVIGLMASRRVGRSAVRTMIGVMVGIGGVGLVLGGVALAMGQPYGVWYPPLLIGVLCLSIAPACWHAVMKQYEQHELGRIAAMDA